MNQLIKFNICLTLIVLTGCSQINIPFMGKSTAQSKTSSNADNRALIANAFVDKGRIVDVDKLQNGRNLAIIPFKAGSGAYATNELDKSALMIIKGISDAFDRDENGKHAHFKLLTADNSDNADLIVRGHITHMGGPSKIKRWVMLKRKKKLGVEGKIIDAKTGSTVLIFQDEKGTSKKHEDYNDLGYRVGNDIGQYILSAIE